MDMKLFPGIDISKLLIYDDMKIPFGTSSLSPYKLQAFIISTRARGNVASVCIDFYVNAVETISSRKRMDRKVLTET